MRNNENIYLEIKTGKATATFIGRSVIRDYLCYVLGKGIQMNVSDSVVDDSHTDFYIVDDITEDNHIEKSSDARIIMLSDFIDVLNDVHIPNDRPVALWGGGIELDKQIGTIMKYCSPKVIIDQSKEGEYLGIPFVRKEQIDIGDFFIIVTTTKYAGEISSFLVKSGRKEGEDFILGANPAFLNNNAQLFRRAITAEPLKKVACRRPFTYLNVGVSGLLTHCCYEWLPIFVGNVLNNSENAYDTITSRIIRVSFMNQSYAFCNTVCCPFMSNTRDMLCLEDKNVVDDELYMHDQNIVDVDVAFDNTCNLFCESCRDKYIIDNSDGNIQIAEKISESLLPKVHRLTVAGNGEVFLSKAYARIFDKTYPNTVLTILSNGNIFTEDKWKMIDGKFKDIILMFSVDAATKETYEKVRRGGRWENVMRGLSLASKLKKEGKISKFIIRFVVSNRNYIEMPDFVRLGSKLGCDIVDFSRIENWGTFSESEFEEVSMFIGDEPKEEMKKVLSLPEMRNEIVHYTNIVAGNT